jgi:uncharacterized membrane protein
MIVKQLLTSPIAFIVYAIVLSETCWITNRRVDEQHEVSAGRLIFAFLGTLSIVVVLTVLFSIVVGWVATSVLADRNSGPGFGGYVLGGIVAGLLFGPVLGSLAAAPVALKISKLLWPKLDRG